MLNKQKLLQRNCSICMIEIEMALLTDKKVFIQLTIVSPMLVDAYRGMSKAFNPT